MVQLSERHAAWDVGFVLFVSVKRRFAVLKDCQDGLQKFELDLRQNKRASKQEWKVKVKKVTKLGTGKPKSDLIMWPSSALLLTLHTPLNPLRQDERGVGRSCASTQANRQKQGSGGKLHVAA